MSETKKSVKRAPCVLEARDLMKVTGGQDTTIQPSEAPLLGMPANGPKKPNRPILGFFPSPGTGGTSGSEGGCSGKRPPIIFGMFPRGNAPAQDE